jgi:nonribosomal peptide synthetase DhbF
MFPERKTNLSKGQQVIWAGQRLYPDSPLFNAAGYEIISRSLDLDHLKRAWAALVRNSDALRTVFVERQGVPLWQVLSDVPWSLPVFDLSGESDPDAAIAVWAQERCQMALNLGSCLFDIALVRLAPQRCALYTNVHHIVCDQWSNAVICRQLGRYYELSLCNRLHEAEPLPPFSKFLESEPSQEAASNSASSTDTTDAATPLAFYGRSSEIKTTTVVRAPYVLEAHQLQRLRKSMQRGPAADKNLLGALVVAFLHRITGSSTLTFGAPFHNRAGWENTIGLLMSILPVTIRIAKDDTISSLERSIATARLRAMRYRDWPAGNPRLRRNYDVEYNYMSHVVPGMLPGSSVRQMWVHPGHGLDPLAIQMFRREGDPDQHCVFDFHADIFDEGCRRQALGDFEDLIDSVIHRPDVTLSELIPQPCKN